MTPFEKIKTAFGTAYGKVYDGIDPASEASTAHVVVRELSVDTITEADNARLWDREQFEVSIFTNSASYRTYAKNASNSLEQAGFSVDSRQFFIIEETKMRQIDITVSISAFAE